MCWVEFQKGKNTQEVAMYFKNDFSLYKNTNGKYHTFSEFFKKVKKTQKDFKRFYRHMHSNTADGNSGGSEIWLIQALVPIRVYDNKMREEQDKKETN